MKKNVLIMMALIASAFVILGCGSSKKTVSQQTLPQSGNYSDPFGPTTRTPLFRPSDENYWYEVGIASGPKARMGQVRIEALRNAQALVREEMQHAYQGKVKELSNMAGDNIDTDYQNKATAIGTKTIDVIVNNTNPIDEISNMDEKGNVTFYRLICISKKETAQKIAKAMSEDKDLRSNFKEEDLRKSMEEGFAKSQN